MGKTIKGLSTMLTDILKPDGTNGMVKGRRGHIVFNRNDMYVGESIKQYGEYSENEIALFEQLVKPGDQVVDVGANIGTHTLALSQIVTNSGFVFAFEPQAIVFQILCANMAVNSVINVDCQNLIVSRISGATTLPRFDYSIQGNYGGVSIEDHMGEGDRVGVVSLDEYLYDVAKLNFIKVDVEGHELEVLVGATNLIRKFSPILYVENDKPSKSKDLIEHIDMLGYNMYWHLPKLFNENNFAGKTEDVFDGCPSINMLCIHKSVKTELDGFARVDDFNFHPCGGEND